MKKYQVDYIYFGQKEREVSQGGINVKDLDIFKKIYDDVGISIYEVK